MFALKHSCHCIPKETFTSWHTTKETFAFIAYPQKAFASWHAPMGHSHHGILPSRHLHSLHTQAGIRVHCITKRAFASWHAPSGHLHHSMHQWDIRIIACTNGTFASWHITKRTFASWRTHKGAFTSWHTYMSIYIMTYPHEHLHHDIPTWTFASWHTHKWTFASWHAPRGHLHHDIPTKGICIMTCPLKDICTTRHFASPSL